MRNDTDNININNPDIKTKIDPNENKHKEPIHISTHDLSPESVQIHIHESEKSEQTANIQKSINSQHLLNSQHTLPAQPDPSQDSKSIDYDLLRERLNDLRKQKRENEYFIRISEQAKKFKVANFQREIRKKTSKIKKFRINEFHPTPYIASENDKEHSNSLGTNDDPNPDDLKLDIDININGIEIDPGIELLVKEVSQLRRDLETSVEEIEFKIEEKRIENIEIDNLLRNNWGEDNTQTINKWINELNTDSFIYERIREIIQNKLTKITLTIFILSSIQTLLNMSNFGISEEDHPDIGLIIKIVLAVLSLLVSVITYYISTNKFEDTIQLYTKYTGRLDNFLSVIVPVMKIKPELRPDGDQFVLENTKDYSDIYRDSPYISESYRKQGFKDYKNYVLNADPLKEMHCSRKRTDYAEFARQNNKNIQNVDSV